MIYKHKQIGLRLKELREQMGLTQKEMSLRLSLSQPTYSRIESGASALESIHLDILIEENNVNRTWLMRGIGDKFSTTTAEIITIPVQNENNNSLGEYIEKIKGLEAIIQKQKEENVFLREEITFLREIVKSGILPESK